MEPNDLPDPAARPVFLRRLVFATLVAATIAGATFEMLRLLSLNGMQPLEWPILALFVTLMVPIALGFWTAVFGFLVQLRGRDHLALSPDPGALAAVELSSFRTAVVVPAGNEDVVRLFAGLKANLEGVAATGELEHFDFFLLSDTTDPDIWVREEVAFEELRRASGQADRLFYRNRRDNADRKAGNIADFCRHWGERYRYMIVLDADSVMSGWAFLDLVGLMERHPTAGIIQTPPVAVNRRSLFGRILQFATRIYGPTFVKGLNFWQAGEGNFWGHNAIVRVRPFTEHCRLPRLPGKEPLGGSILSHDFVEAALMRRAGWRVYLASELGGSYEEIPANLIGHAARDRRWCQGNLQHTRLLLMPGLNWISRLHLGMGVMAYLSSPLWLTMLALSTIEGVRSQLMTHHFFRPDSLFPVWHVAIVHRAILLFTSVMTLLLLPKLLSLIGLLARQRRSLARFGGGPRLVASVLAETVFSVLLAPMLAALHTRFVVSVLMGRQVKWASQDRGDVETRVLDAVRWHLGLTVLGAAWAALLLVEDRALFWWLSPVLAGLVLSIPFSIFSGKVRAGRWARRRGLFLTPEEVQPPAVLRGLEAALREAAERPWAEPRDGLDWVRYDPQVRAIHLGLLDRTEAPEDPLVRHRLAGLVLKLRTRGASSLLPREKRELLRDAEAVEAIGAIGAEATPGPDATGRPGAPDEDARPAATGGGPRIDPQWGGAGA